MRRLLKYLLWVPVSLFLLLLLTVLTLVGTAPGTRWLISIADAVLPAELVVADSKGTLLSGVTLTDLRYVAPDQSFQIQSLTVDWRPRRLLARGVLSFAKLHLSGVEIALPATEEQQEQKPIAIPELRTPLAIELDSFVVQDLALVQGETRQLIRRVELVSSLVGNRLELDRVAVESDIVTADLSGTFVIAEPFKTDLKIGWMLRTPEHGVLNGSGNFKGNLHELKVQHALLSPLEIKVDGVADVLATVPELDFRIHWDDISWPPEGFPAIELLGPVQSRAGALQVAGTAEHYRLQLQTELEFGQLPKLELALQGKGDGQGFDVESLNLRALDGNLNVQGQVRWLPDLMTDLELQGQQLPIDQLLPKSYIPEVLSNTELGRLSLDANVIAQMDQGKPVIQVSIRGLDGTIGGKQLHVDGGLAITPQVFVLDKINLKAGSNHLQANGRFAEQLRLDLKINAVSLKDIVPDIQGAITGNLAVNGTRQKPRASVDLQANNLALAGNEIKSLVLRGDIDLQNNTPSDLRFEATELKFGEQVVHRASIKAKGVPAAHTIDVAVEHGLGRLALGLNGAWSGNRWQGELKNSELAPADYEAWQQVKPVKLLVDTRLVQLGSACWQQANSQLCLDADVELKKDFHVSGALHGFDLKELQGLLPRGVDLSGSAEANFAVQGDLSGDTPQATVEFNYHQPQIVLRYQPADPEEEVVETRFNALKLHASGDTERLSVDGIMEGEHTGETQLQLTVAQLLSESASVSGSLNTRINDLGFLAGLHSAIGKIGGAFTVDAQVAGSFSQPQISGRLHWSDGVLQLPLLGTDYNSVEIILDAKDVQNTASNMGIASEFEINGSANSGDGEISIKGSGNFADLSRWGVEVLVAGQNFQAVQLPDTDITVSPNINFSGHPESLRVRGSLAIPRTHIVLKQLPENAVKTSSDAVVHRSDTSETKPATFAVDTLLDLQLGDAVHLQGFGLNTRLTGNLALALRPDGTTRANGVLNLEDGQFLAYGQKLTVERGTMVYSGPLDNPALDVRAVREVGDVKVGLLIRGLAKNPETIVFSEPAMPEANALAYLLLGRPLSQSEEGDGQMLQNAAIALGLKQILPIAQQISSALGLDELTVEGDKTEDTAITAGQNIGNKLSLKYSYGVFSRIGALILEYKLNRNLSLETRASEASSIDLIYRVEKD